MDIISQYEFILKHKEKENIQIEVSVNVSPNGKIEWVGLPKSLQI